jgi:ribose transport system ATP-binding protein
MLDQTPRLQLEHISKSFPGVNAVQDVSVSVMPGEILALAGENGAGKTTLMNVLNGVIQAEAGTITLDGEPVTIASPHHALALGITMIHQELALIPELTVGQNIFLGREPRRRGVRGLVDWKKLYANAQIEIDRLGLPLSARSKIVDLSIAQQQLVEIAKALSYRARLIVLDEPTSALTEREAETLFKLVRALRDQGVSLIYISHRLEEIFALSDRAAVMRDGRLVGVAPTRELNADKVVQWMVGRELAEFYPKADTSQGAVILRAIGLKRGKDLAGVDLELRRGEIVGLAGLVGAGRTLVARALFGADRLDAGEIWIDGRRVNIRSPRDAIRLGIGLVPEDRKTQGVFLGQSVRSNVGVGLLGKFSRFGWLIYRRVEQLVNEMIQRLGVRTPSTAQRVRNLSGGNQQKVVIARWLALNPKVLILDEPTRGIDVAAKATIYQLINDLAANNGGRKPKGVLVVSSYLPELMGICDRIAVMCRGRLGPARNVDEVDEHALMLEATGQATLS